MGLWITIRVLFQSTVKRVKEERFNTYEPLETHTAGRRLRPDFVAQSNEKYCHLRWMGR